MDRKFFRERPSPANQAPWYASASQRYARDAAVAAPRQDLRRAVDLEVIINHGLTYSAPWRLRDLSLTGAFVENSSEPLSEGSYVEVVLRYRLGNQFKEQRLAATVARAELNGMALVFEEYKDNTYTDLANLLCVLP